MEEYFKRPLTDEERKEIMAYLDDFLYHMEDNFGMRMEYCEELKSLKLSEICKQLNRIYAKLENKMG